MPEPSERPEPSIGALIARGIAMIVCAIVAANLILALHAPVGH